jgi:hypothetical protein
VDIDEAISLLSELHWVKDLHLKNVDFELDISNKLSIPCLVEK